MPEDETKGPLIGDLAGAGKLADSKLLNKVYDDALSPLMHQLGEISEDVAKAGRLVFLPLRMLAANFDRIAKWIEDIAKDVPDERRQEAPPSITGPVLRKLLETEDENPLVQLYLELLKRAIDKERCDEAHPAFVKIIEQLSPDEALMLFLMRKPKKKDDGKPVDEFNYSSPGDFPELRNAENAAGYALHLDSLKLAACTQSVPKGIVQHPSLIRPTSLGRMFIKAVIPEDFTL